MRFIGRFIAGAVALMLLDTLWISANLSSYKAATEAVQGSPMKVKMLPAVLAYILLLVTLWGLLTYAKETRERHGRAYYAAVAFGTGVVIYGVYNATNAALLSNYDARLAIQDTLWGGTLLALTTSFALWI